MNLYTSKDAARIFNVHPSRISPLARNRGIRKIGWQWIFTDEDIEKMRPGKVGNPNIYKESPNWRKRKNR